MCYTTDNWNTFGWAREASLVCWLRITATTVSPIPELA